MSHSSKYLLILFLLLSCKGKQPAFDASGSFEADEVLVSSELGGQLLHFNVNEGDSIAKGQMVGDIDADYLSLQKQQVEATIQALGEKTTTAAPTIALLKDQLAVQQSQLANLEHEKRRIEKLLQADAATGKQLDDINAQIDVTRKQMSVTRQQIAVQQSNTGTQNRSVLSEGEPLRKQAATLEEQIGKSKIINPISGIVTTKYAEAGEVTSPGKALYKIADLSVMTLRAYVTGRQLPEIKLNQPVKVYIDKGEDDYRQYDGRISWISGKAEFTPKTIQTKDERANLVYAVKIKVKNDGYLKMGMYGEVKFKPEDNASRNR